MARLGFAVLSFADYLDGLNGLQHSIWIRVSKRIDKDGNEMM